MKKAFLAGVTLLCAAAVSATAGASSVAAQGSTEQAQERQVCRAISTVGTRLRQRICMTRSQWEQQDRDQRNAAKSLVEREADGRNTETLGGDRPL